MFRIIFGLILSTSTVSSAAPWQELKTGEDVMNCFGSRAEKLAAPFFSAWSTRPQWTQMRTFEASWNDSAGGAGTLVLPTGAPPAMLTCLMARTKNALGQEVVALMCAPNMANGIAYAKLTRKLNLGKTAQAVDEAVPLIMIKDNRMWCATE